MRNIPRFRKPWLLSTFFLLPALGFAQVTPEFIARNDRFGFDAARIIYRIVHHRYLPE